MQTSETIWRKAYGGSMTPHEVAVLFADDHLDEPRKVGPVLPDGPCLTGDQRYTFRLADDRRLYSLRLDVDGVWTVRVQQEEQTSDDQ